MPPLPCTRALNAGVATRDAAKGLVLGSPFRAESERRDLLLAGAQGRDGGTWAVRRNRRANVGTRSDGDQITGKPAPPSAAVHFTTLSRRRQLLQGAVHNRSAKGPLHLNARQHGTFRRETSASPGISVLN